MLKAVLAGALLVMGASGCRVSHEQKESRSVLRVYEMTIAPAVEATVTDEDTIAVSLRLDLTGHDTELNGPRRWGRMVFHIVGNGEKCDFPLTVINHIELPQPTYGPPFSFAPDTKEPAGGWGVPLEFSEAGSNLTDDHSFFGCTGNERVTEMRVEIIGLDKRLEEKVVADTGWKPLNWRITRSTP